MIAQGAHLFSRSVFRRTSGWWQHLWAKPIDVAGQAGDNVVTTSDRESPGLQLLPLRAAFAPTGASRFGVAPLGWRRLSQSAPVAYSADLTPPFDSWFSASSRQEPALSAPLFFPHLPLALCVPCEPALGPTGAVPGPAGSRQGCPVVSAGPVGRRPSHLLWNRAEGYELTLKGGRAVRTGRRTPPNGPST